MLRYRLRLSRISPVIRPLRIPNAVQQSAHPRLFTHNSQLLLISPASPRPQLPFLYHPSGLRAPNLLARSPFQTQISRLITTETKKYLKEQFWLAGKYSIYGWTFLFLIWVIGFGFENERIERKHPSTSTWQFWTRVMWRAAHAQEIRQEEGGITDWAMAAFEYRGILQRLENPAIDGAGLKPVMQEEGDLYIEGVGKAGLDITAKSEPWRRGYYAVLMGAAKSAEHIDGWLVDKERRIAFPPECVLGPSNPRPRPCPPGAPTAPHEKDCEPAFESPEFYYTKILTTHGFTSRQRLDAAIAYADWLDFKGLHTSAEEVYDWGLDIAMGALPVGVNEVVDVKTGIIDKDASYVSSNILLATTALAIHHAQKNNLAIALPIFLSILRARRQLPSSTKPAPTKSDDTERSSLDTFIAVIKSLLVTPPYPPPPPTGDELPSRTPSAVCEEAGIMAHIGEILFASSTHPLADPVASSSHLPLIHNSSGADALQSQQSGLSWTRDCVDLAESVLQSPEAKDDREARKRCAECLEVGISNWSKMVARMLWDEKAHPNEQHGKKVGWLWGTAKDEDVKGRWEREAKLVEEREKRVRNLLAEEERRSASGAYGMIFS